MRGPVLFAAALIAAAGCVQQDDPAPQLAPRSPVVTSIAFDIVGASTPVADAASNQPNGGPVHVGANTTVLVMEARWTCAGAACELRLLLFDDSNDLRGADNGTLEGRLLVETSEQGLWNAQVRATTAARATGEIRVTAFFGPVPEGFSAFDR